MNTLIVLIYIRKAVIFELLYVYHCKEAGCRYDSVSPYGNNVEIEKLKSGKICLLFESIDCINIKSRKDLCHLCPSCQIILSNMREISCIV